MAHKALGAPNGTIPIEFDFDNPEEKGKESEFAELRQMFTSTRNGKTGSAYYSEFVMQLQKDALDEDTYCIVYMLQALCHVFASRANKNLGRCFLPILKKYPRSMWKNLAWTNFFVDFLIHGMKSYQTSTVQHRKCHGVVLLLEAVAVDFLIEDETLSQELPRINHITQSHYDKLHKLAREDFKSLLSKVKKFNDTVYSKDYLMKESGENMTEMQLPVHPDLSHVPVRTDLSHGTMADASMDVSVPSAIANDLVQKLSGLQRALSAAPEGVTNLIDSLKAEVSSENGKDMVSRLESLLITDREYVNHEVTESKSNSYKLMMVG